LKEGIGMTRQQVLISSRTNAQLIQDWVAIETMEMSTEIAMVRGWLMDEIEKRFPAEFDKWMENCMEDDDIRNYVTI